MALESALEDGTFIETANCTNHAPERSIVATDRMDVVWLPGATFAELLTEHRDRLQRLIGEQAADVVRIDGDNFQTVLNHNQRVFCLWRYRHGDFDQPPPLPDFEQFATMPTVSQSEPMAPPRLACGVAAKISDGNSLSIVCEAV